jgi:iron complex transport system ATP-binding protein
MVVMGRARHIGVFRSPGSRDRAAALHAMDRVGIAALADRLFPTLSGGEQQLVLIARAIAGGSRLLVLDEPSTGLDLKNQVRVLQLLRELVRTGMSLLVSTHHPDHALFLADSVVLMGAEGVVTGPAGPLLADAQLSALYGVRVSTLNYDDAGTPRRTVVTPFGADKG